MTTDNPPPQNTRTISFGQLVRKNDKNYDRELNWGVEYPFSNGRKFYGNPQKRGRYDPNFVDHVNVKDN